MNATRPYARRKICHGVYHSISFWLVTLAFQVCIFSRLAYQGRYFVGGANVGVSSVVTAGSAPDAKSWNHLNLLLDPR